MTKEELHQLMKENCFWRNIQTLEITEEQKNSLTILDKLLQHYKMNFIPIKPDGFIEISFENSIYTQLLINRDGIMKYTTYVTKEFQNFLTSIDVLSSFPLTFQQCIEKFNIK